MYINKEVSLNVSPEKYHNDAYDIVNLFYTGPISRGAAGRGPVSSDAASKGADSRDAFSREPEKPAARDEITITATTSLIFEIYINLSEPDNINRCIKTETVRSDSKNASYSMKMAVRNTIIIRRYVITRIILSIISMAKRLSSIILSIKR